MSVIISNPISLLQEEEDDVVFLGKRKVECEGSEEMAKKARFAEWLRRAPERRAAIAKKLEEELDSDSNSDSDNKVKAPIRKCIECQKVFTETCHDIYSWDRATRCFDCYHLLHGRDNCSENCPNNDSDDEEDEDEEEEEEEEEEGEEEEEEEEEGKVDSSIDSKIIAKSSDKPDNGEDWSALCLNCIEDPEFIE